MRRITERVTDDYLALAPTRPMPYHALPEMISDYLFERPLRAFLDPLLMIGLMIVVLLGVLNAHWALLLIAAAFVLTRLWSHVQRLWRRVADDLNLLRCGVLVNAYILKLRPHRTTTGEINGALLDCALPLGPRQSYIGSIWVSDGNEALRLSRQGRIAVICLPQPPGTWRIVEPVE